VAVVASHEGGTSIQTISHDRHLHQTPFSGDGKLSYTMVSASAVSHGKPYLLILSHIQTGHLTPTLRIASGLVSRGWTVFFLGPGAEEARIKRSGAIFVSLQGDADIHDAALPRTYSSQDGDGSGPASDDARLQSLLEPMTFLPPADVRTVADTITQCYDTIPAQWTSFLSAVRTILAFHEERRPVDDKAFPGYVVLCDAFFHGLLPLYCNPAWPHNPDHSHPLPRPLSSVCISVTPPFLRSRDLPPFGLALPYDPSPAGREAAAREWGRWSTASQSIAQLLDAKIREAGGLAGLDPAKWPFASGANYLLHSGGIVQLGVEGFEYPRSDWPKKFHFVGISPSDRRPGTGSEDLPDWWVEILHNSASSPAQPDRKKIVVVSQGTYQTDHASLLGPTLTGLSTHPHILVIAILGRRGARLPSSLAAHLPANARIADFLPYDAILPHTDLWIHNGGFGAVTHGIAHGVPMVVGGEGQDKGENCRRVAWSGIGIDVGTAKPEAEQVRETVEEVLREAKYRERVQELRRESQGLNTIALVEKALLNAACPN
jgi:hypothetical protein